jgi:allantoin racemase
MRILLINRDTSVSMTADTVADALEREGRLAIEVDQADVLRRGCGGMVGLRERLERNLSAPVIEAVRAATALVRGLIRAGVATPKVRAFTWPEATPLG